LIQAHGSILFLDIGLKITAKIMIKVDQFMKEIDVCFVAGSDRILGRFKWGIQ